jgi:hypothetical protein
VSKRWFDLCRLLEWLLPRKTKENEKKYLSSKTLSSFFRSFRPNTSRSTRPLSQREQAVVRSVSPARMAVAEKIERERKKIPKRQNSFVLRLFLSAKHIPQRPATFSA